RADSSNLLSCRFFTCVSHRPARWQVTHSQSKLHAAPEYASESPEDVRGWAGRVLLHRLRGPDATEAQDPEAFNPAGYERAYNAAITKFEAVHRLTEQIAPDKIELALSSADVRRINSKG